ncbi:MAG TPA: CoA-binding protein [Vicinamibacteria bacterium]|nr:CoA-binding protein [Vicinamibacteria bacterium]
MEPAVKDIASLLGEEGTTIAIVGATDNPSKYGYVIYRDLKRKGYRVYPVNPGRATVDSDPAYRNLASLPVKPTIVNFVVPPKVAAAVLQESLELGLKNIWLQPGAESPENLAFLQENGFNYLANACIMVESRSRFRK